MSATVFRKAALERLSSVEQLDQLVQIVRPRGWLALSTFGAILIAVVFWGWFGSVTIEVAAQGVLRPKTSQTLPLSRSKVEELEATLFLSPDQGSQISKGMEAHIFPDFLNSGQGTPMTGTVVQVETAFTDRGIQSKVEVVLKRDQVRTSVYWPALYDSSDLSGSSMPVNAKIIVRRDHPIELLIASRRRRGSS